MYKYVIKPCPHCGSPAVLKVRSKTMVQGKTQFAAYVFCPACDARGARALYRDFPTVRDARLHAVECWNRRAGL